MNGPIVVINPNSNELVTDGIRDALKEFNLPKSPEIECVTLKEGPFGIESQLDSDSVIIPLVNLVQSRTDAGAFVIACYSDPGLHACRSITKKPVFGIQESGVLSALARADRFGVIAISDASIQRHWRVMARMQVLDRLAGELPLNMSVDESARGTKTLEKLVNVGGLLKKQGADVLVLGCAGMATHRKKVEEALGIPVIDPTQAAVALAMGVLLSNA
ncbi:aspartate/glutamate racemase family protein [Roseobacter sp. HKCCD5988]|uniref:aspartate/glutamate racemase family protein n=1 Tax=Roseobacter sp. HKCCD5988 TaxID=3120338 RepID=UPI0030ED19AA